ncbi:hypothetical protein H5410_002292 [Solanum commersonii]|uniref:Uncharacterized protein n=1 Tax=Solanum commersonii TaxID=4109 RepID=A0A9J6B2G9_SOLCO|nr:hypothetical protein H5410_002292 [Solanum commersonii]
MTSVEELENQCLPMSKLKKYATKWVIKVLVIRRSLTKEYKNVNGEGIRWQLIFINEEDLEVAFMNNTEVVEDKSQSKTQKISNGFISFDEAEKITNESLFDVVCILLKLKPLNGEGRSIRQEVIVTNKRNDNMKAQKINISLMPSKLMQTARQVKITNILNGSLAIVKDMYYKLNATISSTDNNMGPWYYACKKCYKTEDIDSEER